MGVTGLLQHLKEIQEPCTLERYRGKTLAVDTYGWLHRGLISCAQELCQGTSTRKYINYVMKRVDMLCYFGVEPYLVFDGAYLPTKADTAKERRAKREDARAKADAFLKKGDRKSAWKEFMKAAGVTPAMAKSIMVELDARNIKYVVAPYEADPQMVYLEKIGLVDGILSEDSDLLIFGCRKLITKLNDSAECIEIDRANFDKVKKIPYLSKFTQEQLRLVAMLSGCDYTKGVANIGLKTAFNIVKKFDNIEKILVALRADGKKVDPGFKDEVYQANLAFQFQKVFDPTRQCLTMLNEYPDDMDLDLESLEFYCGKTCDADIHVRICNGRIHPNTHEPLVGREQDIGQLRNRPATFVSQSKPISRKPTVPAKGAIDSFFKISSRKTSETVQAVEPVTKTPALSPPLVESKGTSIAAVSETSTTIEVEALKRSFMRRVEQSPQQKLSPISKRIKKYVSPSQKSGDKLSKFFTPNLPAPDTNKEAIESSFASGDSDIPDFSSPIRTKSTPNTDSILSDIVMDKPEVNIKENIDYDNLTDNDEIEDSSPVKQVVSQKPLESDSSDDEIEESPVKPERTRQFALLREKFLMKESLKLTFSSPEQDHNAHMKQGLRQTFISKSESAEVSRELSILEPKNKLLTREDSLIDGHDSPDSSEESLLSLPEPEPVPEKPKKRAHVDLRKFAFTRS